MRHAIRSLSLAGLMMLATACVSTNNEPDIKDPPKITDDMETKEAVDAAITYGGRTFENVKELITKRKAWQQVGRMSQTEMEKRRNDAANTDRFMNYSYLYFASSMVPEPAFVQKMLEAENSAGVRVGWTMATRYPSEQMRAMMERVLTTSIERSEEQRHLLPEMARAVAVNNLDSVYTLVREGLMRDIAAPGNEDFAKAMIEFNGREASSDFGYYLAKANLDDLRQLNQSSVNIYTCLVIFRHLLSQPMALSHPYYDSVFLYAVSRNQVLSEMANLVIERQMAKNRSSLALMLARQKLEVQIAFIENNRRAPSAQIGLFMRELKRITAHKEVVEEIDAMRL